MPRAEEFFRMFPIALALLAAQAAPEPPPEPMEIAVVRDPITDHLRATATLHGDEGRIEIWCESPQWGDVRIEYHSRRWLARGQLFTGQQPITYRFDEGRPYRRLWHVRDRTASFDDKGRVVSFLIALMRSHRLVLRTRDVENHTFDSAFAIGETRGAITTLLNTCGSMRLNPRVLGE
jgi:hypothetical protein